MTRIRALADLTWRDYEVDGVPSSGKRKVAKAEARTLFALVDALVNASAISATTEAQPASPTVGDLYILPVDATGAAWGEMDAGNVVIYLPTGWLEYTPPPGMLVHVQDEELHYKREGASWVSAFTEGGAGGATAQVATTGNITLSGEQTIDGVAVSAGALVLVRAQTAPAQNGLYVVSESAWARAGAMSIWAEFPGAIVTVEQGTANADTAWQCTADQGGTLDTTAVAFAQVSSGTINSVRWGYLAAASAFGGPLIGAANLAALVTAMGGAGGVRTALDVYSTTEVDDLVAGAGGGDVAAHEAAADPHPGYALESAFHADAVTLIGHTFAQMRADLDLEAGTDFYSISAADALLATKQASSANLTTYAGITPHANAQTLLTHSFAQMRADLDLEAGTDFYSISAADALLAAKQAASANLTTYAGIAPHANAQTLLGHSFADMRTDLGLVIGTNVQAFNANLTTWAGIAPSANVQSFAGAADYAAMRSLLGLVIGTNVQAYNANLTTFAAIAPAANVQSMLGAANYAAIRALLDLEAGTDFYSITAADAKFLDKAGGTLTGALSLHADPSSALHAATKQYVDNLAAGLRVKASVRAATTANITTAGEITVDGVALTSGDRVLVKDQSSPAQNGLYTVPGGIAAWTRSTDMDAWTEVHGATVWVEEGTANADKAFVCTSNAGGTLNTTAITWAQFAGTGAFQAASANLTTWAGIAPSANAQSFAAAADYAAMRTLLALVIGTNVQAYNANLTTWAAIAPSANVQSLAGAANYAAMRALLDLEPGTDFYSIATIDSAIGALDVRLDDLEALTANLSGPISSAMVPVVQAASTGEAAREMSVPHRMTNVAALQAATWASADAPQMVVLEYSHTAGDGGGIFRYDASDTSTADNGGTVILTSTSGAALRYKRQYDRLNLRFWNVRNDGTAFTYSAFAAALTFAGSTGQRLLAPAGRYRHDTANGTLTLENVIIEGEGVLDGATPHYDKGTIFEIVGTATSPFTFKRGAGFVGCGFYYPNVVDTLTPTTYASTINFDFTGGTSVQFVLIERCVCFNAFDFIAIDDSGGNVGHVRIIENYIFAFRKSIQIYNNLEHIEVQDNTFTYGFWTDASDTAKSQKYYRENAIILEYLDGDGCWFSSNLIFGAKYGILNQGGVVTLCVIHSNSFDQCLNAIYVSSPSGSMSQTTVADNLFLCFSGNDAALDGTALTLLNTAAADKINVSGNYFGQTRSRHVSIDGTAAGTINFSGNTFELAGFERASGSYASFSLNCANKTIVSAGDVFTGPNTAYVNGFTVTGCGVLKLIGATLVNFYQPVAISACGTYIAVGCSSTGTGHATVSNAVSGVTGEAREDACLWDKPAYVSTYPRFAAGAGTATFNSGSATDAVFGTETFDDGGDYNNSTGVFTAPVPGRYRFDWQLFHDNTVTIGDRWTFVLAASAGPTPTWTYTVHTALHNSVVGSAVISMAAAGTVKLTVTRSVGAGDFVLLNDGGANRFSGELLA